ncbi:Aldehyde/histidinol dehydrogenase [Aspergillus recurvatus]
MSLSLLKRKDLFQQHGFSADKWVSSSSGGTFAVTNPATLGTLAILPEMNSADTKCAIAAAHASFQSFKKTTARQRATCLRKWHALCLENIDDLALILTVENGKTLTEARGESFICCIFSRVPLGVAACLAPWNFPIAMVTRKVGAALAAGCTAVWKPAGETPLSALAQAVLAKEAGFPSGAINVITTLNNVAEAGETLCKSTLVRKLSFTGSTRVGKLLASRCSRNLTKLSLELGGNSPFIVFDDAKIETAVEACILAKSRDSGQTCVTANRIFVQEGIYDRFSTALVEEIKTMRVGNGVEEGVFIGPLTHERAVKKAITRIKDAQEKGASLLRGGSACQPNNLQGYFLEPTVLGKMSIEAVTTREEVFAPVVALYPFKTEEEVLAKANDCNVGLGSFVMTESMPRMWRVAEGLEVGMVGINLGMLSAAESPSGGVKESGYGREGGRQGIEEYLTVKSILMNVAG